ncbi:MAG: hypothetical protein AAGG59_07925 [Bacteroidota bacterium]
MPEEIFKTKTASIAHLERSDAFLLTYEQEKITFRLCDLYTFRKRIMSLDIIRLLEVDAPDLEIICLPHCDRCLVLNLHEILQFRELLNGTFDTLELNSSIQKILRKNVFNF